VNPTVVTVPDVAGAAHIAVPPLTVRTFPVEPIPRDATEAAPVPSNNAPVAQPVGITKAKVPLLVTGLPVMVKPVGAPNDTLVTPDDEARAAMLPAEMLKFAPVRSIGMRSPDCAGFPFVS
jgi:hypothetical protein